MTDLGKFMIGLGLTLVVAGLVLIFMGRANLPLGRLPGDIIYRGIYRGRSTKFYFPLATSIVLSLVLSLVMWALSRWRG